MVQHGQLLHARSALSNKLLNKLHACMAHAMAIRETQQLAHVLCFALTNMQLSSVKRRVV